MESNAGSNGLSNPAFSRKCPILFKVLLTSCLMLGCFLLTSHNHELIPINRSPSLSHRRLDWTVNCPPDLLSTLPYPQIPSTPFLKTPTYLASFPGSGDKIFSKYLVEMISGMEVGEAAVSPSLYKMTEMKDQGVDLEYRGQGEVVGVRTHFPHTSGKLASWDMEIPRAVVILRNPIHAIPSYFNEMYELRNHLPPGSSRDPQHAQDTHTTWLKWRDAQFPSQLMLYRRFVSFWMERHLEDDVNRIFFTYEDFVEWYKGPGEARRMFTFLKEGITNNVVEMVNEGGLEGVTIENREKLDQLIGDATKNMIREEDVPCLWKDLINPTPATQQNNRHLQSVDPPYSSSAGGDWDHIARPLTPENLASLSQMLLELMNRWSRHQRVLNVMAGYHRVVNKLYLEVVEALEKEEAQQQQQVNVAPEAVPLEAGSDVPPESRVDLSSEELNEPTAVGTVESNQQGNNIALTKNFHIIQASPTHTASTVATNWLIGLFEPFSDYAFMSGPWPETPIQQSGKEVNIEAHMVTKTHDLDLLRMYKTIKPLFDEVFFVVSHQQSDLGRNINEEVCRYKNVLCISYDELVFTSPEELIQMVKNLTTKLKTRFQYFFGTTEWLTEKEESSCIRRLQDMAKAKRDMVAMPVDKSDLKYGVHGGGQKKCPPKLAAC